MHLKMQKNEAKRKAYLQSYSRVPKKRRLCIMKKREIRRNLTEDAYTRPRVRYVNTWSPFALLHRIMWKQVVGSLQTILPRNVHFGVVYMFRNHALKLVLYRRYLLPYLLPAKYSPNNFKVNLYHFLFSENLTKDPLFSTIFKLSILNISMSLYKKYWSFFN